MGVVPLCGSWSHGGGTKWDNVWAVGHTVLRSGGGLSHTGVLDSEGGVSHSVMGCYTQGVLDSGAGCPTQLRGTL